MMAFLLYIGLVTLSVSILAPTFALILKLAATFGNPKGPAVLSSSEAPRRQVSRRGKGSRKDLDKFAALCSSKRAAI